jgi:hypothetical protein
MFLEHNYFETPQICGKMGKMAKKYYDEKYKITYKDFSGAYGG